MRSTISRSTVSSATAQQLSLTSPCWGAGQPAGGKGQTLPPTSPSTATPARSALTLAHDFDVVFCAYKPQTNTPHVYEISLSSCSGTYGNCRLNVTDYGTSCIPGVGSPSSATLGASGCSSGKVVETFSHIWCDAYCQGSTSAGTNAAGQSVARACQDVPGNTVAGCATETPPMFEYFNNNSNGVGGQYGESTTEDSNSLNFSVENKGAVSEASCTGGLYMDLGSTTPATCDGSVAGLAKIQLISLNVTLLNPNGLPLTSSASSTGRSDGEINEQIYLPGVTNPTYPCGAAMVELPAAPVGLWELNDAGIPITNLVQGLDSATVAGSPVYNQTPGPEACNANNGGISLSGAAGQSFVDSTYFNSATSAGSSIGSQVTVEAWIDPSSFSTTPSRIVSNGDSAASSGSGFELYELANGAGVAFQVGTSLASESTALSASNWYFVVGTTTTTGITIYLCGATLASGSTPGCVSSTTTGAHTVSYPSSGGCDLLVGAMPTPLTATGAVACTSPEPTVSSTSSVCPSSDYPSSIPAGCPANFFAGSISNVALYSAITSGTNNVLNNNQVNTQYLEMAQ